MMGFLDWWFEQGLQPQYNSHCIVKHMLFFLGTLGSESVKIQQMIVFIQQNEKRRVDNSSTHMKIK